MCGGGGVVWCGSGGGGGVCVCAMDIGGLSVSVGLNKEGD